MKLYHMSQTLKQGDALTPGFQKNIELSQPFIQALERSEECFYAMVLNGKYMYAVLSRFKMWEWADYAKWSVEGAFEYIRKTEFPDSYSRLNCSYFYDNLADCRRLFKYDWGNESEEERRKVHLYEIELADPAPQARDMSIYDKAYEAMSERQDVQTVLDCARRYFSGEQSSEPVLEILSDKAAIAAADITHLLNDDAATAEQG